MAEIMIAVTFLAEWFSAKRTPTVEFFHPSVLGSVPLFFFFRGSGIHNTRSSPHGSTEARVTDNRAYNLSL